MGKVRQRLEDRRALPLDAFELDLELLDLQRSSFARFVQMRSIHALPLRARDLVAGGVLLALQSFNEGNQAAAFALHGCQLLQLRRHIETAPAQTFTNRFDV